MTLVISILDDTRSLPPPALDWWKEHLARIARKINVTGELRIRAVDDAAMSQAHRQFSGIEGTTDVLTFDLLDGSQNPPQKPQLSQLCSGFDRTEYGVDSDILTCVDEAARHSLRGGYPIERELLLYSVHGLLHCLGWDDHEEAEAAAMHELEDALLVSVGVGRVYDPG